MGVISLNDDACKISTPSSILPVEGEKVNG